MRQLREWGWMHHLARHSVACFLTRGDLYISWEEGQAVFEELLIDAVRWNLKLCAPAPVCTSTCVHLNLCAPEAVVTACVCLASNLETPFVWFCVQKPVVGRSGGHEGDVGGLVQGGWRKCLSALSDNIMH